MNKQVLADEIDLSLARSQPETPIQYSLNMPRRALPRGFAHAKRLFDVTAAILALPIVAAIALVLLVINPIWNKGPLFFTQKRMGQGCRPFMAYKFRTMRCTASVSRGPFDPLETDRITRLGKFLRQSRIDEFPQFLNVLFGQMSVIGPRPDYWEHAQHYSENVPGYRRRYVVRPGITGLAQVDAGYAQGRDETARKTHKDLEYIAKASVSLDLYVIRRTMFVMVTGFGAR